CTQGAPLWPPAAFAFPAIATAEATEEEGAVVESPAPSPAGPWFHWTQQRMEEAEPLPIVTLPSPAGSESSDGPEVPAEPELTASPEAPSATGSEGADTAAVRSAAARTAAVEGVE